MPSMTVCPDCHVAHVNVRCPKAPKLCANRRTAREEITEVPHYAACCEAARAAAADLDRLRAVWRAVVERFGDANLPQSVADAAIEAGLADEQRDDAGSVTVLTPDGARLAKGEG